MTWRPRPVVLDLDGSVGPLPNEHRIALTNWQERLRFGCSMRVLEHFGSDLDERLPPASMHGTVLLGSGDFHHLTPLLIARQLRVRTEPIEVIVLDNHPDNMRFPTGIHCGSWVTSVASLPGVSHVHVVGITSSDLGWTHAWENRLANLYAGRLTYWCTGNQTGWSRLAGLGHAVREFATPDELVERFGDVVRRSAAPVYLSVDKDVFSAEVVRTNWDQGRLLDSHARTLIHAMSGRIVGSDITGDVSAYRYRTPWKRWLSRVDGQAAPTAAELESWRPGQRSVDRLLVDSISRADRAHDVPPAHVDH